MRPVILLLCALCLVACDRIQVPPLENKAAEEKQADAQYKKEIEEIRKTIRGDIRVKLKKDAKGGYGWEITGKDVQEVLKANEALRKKLSE